MDPRFTRGEYWLLQNVVEHEFAIGALMSNDLECFENKEGHGLTRPALIETLHRLITSGLIYAKNEVDGLLSTSQQIERALNEPTRHNTRIDEKKITAYGLTQEGGAQWEAFAKPDWQKYIKADFLSPDDTEHGIWELISADKDLLETYYESFCFYRQLAVSSETVAWDYIAPWEATYWKQLEGAYSVRFHHQEKNAEEKFERYPPPYTEHFRRGWYTWQ